MRALVGVMALLIVYDTEAGDVLVNGVNMGKLSGMTIDYASDKTGKIVIKTLPAPALVDEGNELLKCYLSKETLYAFLIKTHYRGAVYVDGVKIRSGIKAAVHFKKQSDGSVCR